MKYISSIRSKAEPYGICRIVPPSSWKPPCPLKEKGIWEGSKFATRVQRIDKLQNRESVRNVSRIQSNMKRKRRRCTRMGVENGTRRGPNVGFCEAERFGFEPGPEFTLETFQRYADDFKDKYFRKNENASHLGTNTTTLNGTLEPSVENIEGEYWRMVESPTEEIEVSFLIVTKFLLLEIVTYSLCSVHAPFLTPHFVYTSRCFMELIWKLGFLGVVFLESLVMLVPLHKIVT